MNLKHIPIGNCWMTLVAVLALSARLLGNNTTYYIDNSGSPPCSNSYAGTSSSNPWCDFTNVNGHTFAQGDQILLKSGDWFVFSPNLTEQISNPGFETGTTSGWTAQNCAVSATTTNPHSGSYSCFVSSRSATNGSPVQDFTALLNSTGEQNFEFSAWVKMASGTDSAYIIIAVTDDLGTHLFAGNSVNVNSTGYTQLTGPAYVYFKGPLQSAKIYVQTGTLGSFYLDDFSLKTGNLVSNSGFENGTTGWTAQNSTISATAGNGTIGGPFRGADFCLVTNRTVTSSSPAVDVTSALSSNGQGYYSYGVYARLATGSSDTGAIVLKIVDSSGTHWYSSSFYNIGTSLYTGRWGNDYVTWTGTLSSATLYFQTGTGTEDIYLDNFTLARNSGVSPFGSGVSGNPITIGCYPTNSCLTTYAGIRVDGLASDCIKLVNPSYWTISNLTLTGGVAGVKCSFNQLGNQGLTFKNLYTTSLNGRPIVFDGYNEVVNPTGSTTWGTPVYGEPQSIASGSYIYSNVSITNVSAVNDRGLIAFMADYPNTQMLTAGYPNAQQNIVVTNFVNSGSNGCMMLANAQNVTFLNDSFDQGDIYGSCGTPNYITAITSTSWINGMYKRSPDWLTSPDNAVFVFDNHQSSLSWRGNYFANNAASAIEGKENPDFENNTASTNSSFEISNNGFSNNSTLNYGPDSGNAYGYYGDIDSSYSPKTTGTISNNLYYDTVQNYNAFTHNAPSAYWTLTNNRAVGAAGDLYSAPDGFSGTQGSNQWSYQLWNGSALSNLPTFSSSPFGEWSESGTAYSYGFINAFEMAPDNDSTHGIVRVWTAPKTGTVSVRGWALKSVKGGNSLRIGIATPAAWIWPNSSGWLSGSLGANDQTGFSTSVDSVSVTAGDTISFWIGNTGSSNADLGVVSWTPMIAYTAGPLVSQGASVTTSTYTTGGAGSNAVDGDNGTYWCASSGAFPQWLDVDLGASYSLSEVQTIFYASETWKYKIEGSLNNSTWSTLIDRTATGITSQSSTDSVSGSYRYVKITVTSGSVDWAAIRELKVYSQ